MDSHLEKTREQYKAITYKIESDACRDEFGLLNKEVIDEIQEWNKDVRFYQNIQEERFLGEPLQEFVLPRLFFHGLTKV